MRLFELRAAAAGSALSRVEDGELDMTGRGFHLVVQGGDVKGNRWTSLSGLQPNGDPLRARGVPYPGRPTPEFAARYPVR